MVFTYYCPIMVSHQGLCPIIYTWTFIPFIEVFFPYSIGYSGISSFRVFNLLLSNTVSHNYDRVAAYKTPSRNCQVAHLFPFTPLCASPRPHNGFSKKHFAIQLHPCRRRYVIQKPLANGLATVGRGGGGVGVCSNRVQTPVPPCFRPNGVGLLRVSCCRPICGRLMARRDW